MIIRKKCSHENEIFEGGMEKAFTRASECLNVSRSTVSHHIKELENSGLINVDALNEVKKFLE